MYVHVLRTLVWLSASLKIHVKPVLSLSLSPSLFSLSLSSSLSPLLSLSLSLPPFSPLFLSLPSFSPSRAPLSDYMTECENTHRKHKVRRFWTDRRKAVQFYTQLGILLLLVRACAQLVYICGIVIDLAQMAAVLWLATALSIDSSPSILYSGYIL